MRPADFTLSAGPTTVSAEVMAAMGQPIIYHYDPSFLEAFARTGEKAAKVFGTKEDVILMQGEAVVGLEAAGRACVRPGMKVLNLISGVFGKGMSDWLKMWGADVIDIEVPYNDAVTPEAVEKALKENPAVELVTVVHSETPSGTLNPVAEIGPMVRAHGAVSIVDCVSSVAGMPFHPDEWQLDICVSGAQKCLSGPPGITPMTVSKQAWALIDRNPDAPRYSFVALLDWREIYLKGGRFPFTPSVSDVFGLEACLDWVLEQGLDTCIAQHTIAAQACRAGARAMGLTLWPKSEAIMSTCTTAITVPEGLTDVQVRDHVRGRYGVQISAGQNAGNLIRIGHMGVTARSLYPIVGLSALGRGLADLGVKVDVGAGVEAALEVISTAGAQGGQN
ncbi:MAG: alanine--glyoxylate aminotransferase family protein [bacterium]